MANSSQNPSINQHAVDIATEAYLYGLPLILVDITKEQSLQKGSKVNQFTNSNQFVGFGDTVVVRPNCDTFYSSCFFDLSKGPLILSIPDTYNAAAGKNQYYMMPLLDAFTNVIAGSPGTRTGQIAAGEYLLVGPTAGIPDGANVDGYIPIPCPTNMVWAIGRFQVDNPSLTDYELNGGGYVASLQSQLSITDLSLNPVAYGIPNADPQAKLPTPNDLGAQKK